MFNSGESTTTAILLAVQITVSLVLIWWLRSLDSRWLQVACGLVIGGALGNVIDRAIQMFGAGCSFACLGLFSIGLGWHRHRLGHQPGRHRHADGTSAEHDQWEGQVEDKQRDERRHRQPQLEPRAQRPARDTQHRLHDNRQYRRLDAEEQRRKPARADGRDIEEGQRQHHQRAGDHE